MITKSIGSENYKNPDIFTLDIELDDLQLLCSNGLTSVIPDIEILRILTQSNQIKLALIP